MLGGSVYAATLPFIHNRLATLTAEASGEADGEPVSWMFSDSGDLVDITVNPTTHEASAEAEENG